MPQANVNDVKLYYREAGSGEPIIFAHEFAGDFRSWEPQVRYFSRRYRCIVYNARGYPPSEVPEDVAAYSQNNAADDLAGVLRYLAIPRAHVVGLSMGAFAALHFGLRYPDMAASLVLAGGGYGALPVNHDQFAAEARTMADRIEAEGIATVATDYSTGPYRLPFKRKDSQGWQEFANHLAHHATQGSALTMRGYQGTRPPFTDFEEELKKMSIPVLILAGDEDEPSLDPSLYLKRTIPSAALCVLPKTGHTINLEEPALFNHLVQDFLATVATGRWETRELNPATDKIL